MKFFFTLRTLNKNVARITVFFFFKSYTFARKSTRQLRCIVEYLAFVGLLTDFVWLDFAKIFFRFVFLLDVRFIQPLDE